MNSVKSYIYNLKYSRVYSLRVPMCLTTCVCHMFFEVIELARCQTQRNKMVPSPLPESRSGAGNTRITSLIPKGYALAP